MYLTRRPIRNYTFAGTKISLQKGQQVVIPIYAIQNDPNVYSEPEVFDPERFTAENMAKRNPMYHLPFGDGPRNCIGNLRTYGSIRRSRKHTYISTLELRNIKVCHTRYLFFRCQICH